MSSSNICGETVNVFKGFQDYNLGILSTEVAGATAVPLCYPTRVYRCCIASTVTVSFVHDDSIDAINAYSRGHAHFDVGSALPLLNRPCCDFPSRMGGPLEVFDFEAEDNLLEGYILITFLAGMSVFPLKLKIGAPRHPVLIDDLGRESSCHLSCQQSTLS